MTMIRTTLRTLLVIAVMACAITSTADAQFMKREITFSGSVGLQYPTGDFGSRLKRGSGFRGEVGFFASPSWMLSLAGAYHRYDSEFTARAAYGMTGQRYISGTANATLFLYPESWFTPYATSGLGLYKGRQWYQSGSVETTRDKSRMGLLGGFGLSAHKMGSRLSLFSEVVYHHVIIDNGGSDQAVVWNTGLRISFGGRPF